MASFGDLPVDIVELIAKSGGVEAWLSICRGSRHFSRLSTGVHRSNILKALTVVSVDAYGSKWWVVEGKQHREGDLPAVIGANGSKLWFVEGKRHREGDLPAVILADGSKQWWNNGERIKN